MSRSWPPHIRNKQLLYSHRAALSSGTAILQHWHWSGNPFQRGNRENDVCGRYSGWGQESAGQLILTPVSLLLAWKWFHHFQWDTKRMIHLHTDSKCLLDGDKCLLGWDHCQTHNLQHNIAARPSRWWTLLFITAILFISKGLLWGVSRMWNIFNYLIYTSN